MKVHYLVFVLSLTFGIFLSTTANATIIQPIEQDFIDELNTVRESYGSYSPLSFDYRLYNSAVMHNIDMADNNFFDHAGSDGSYAWDRAVLQGYPSYGVVDLLYFGELATANDVVTAWMGSPNYRDVILEQGIFTGYNYQAIGVAVTSYSGGFLYNVVLGDSQAIAMAVPEPNVITIFIIGLISITCISRCSSKRRLVIN